MDVPLDETLGALDDLVRAGKVRYVGTSTSPAWHVLEAMMTSELKGLVRVVSEQSPYNLLDRRIENELLPMCRRHGVGVLCWSPLAMGMLAGRYASSAGREDDSRATLRGGIYAERVTEAGIDDGQRVRGAGARARLRAGAAGGGVDEGAAGRDGADHRPEVASTSSTGLLPAGDLDAARRAARRLRRAGRARQLRRQLLQLGAVDGVEAVTRAPQARIAPWPS